jgi:hypothetical protein
MIVTNYTPEDLKKLPLRAIVALAARCARRVERLALLPDGHPQQERCRKAAATAVRLAEGYASGSPCSSAESAVVEIEECRAIANCDFIRDSALATFSLAARAAVNALRACDLCAESANSHAGGSRGPDAIGHLADVNADLAARDTFTAAFEAVAADRHTDGFIKAAIADYERMLRLDLGRYPEPGSPIDPSAKGPLGPLGLKDGER